MSPAFEWRKMFGSVWTTTRTQGTGDLFSEMLKATFSRDEFWEGSGDYILKRGSYCATHPLAKNSFWSQDLNTLNVKTVLWSDLIAYLYHETTIIICLNKFTLFQTSVMTDEELDLYWAEIAQVSNITENVVLPSTPDCRFSNFLLSLAVLHILLGKSVSPSSLSPVLHFWTRFRSLKESPMV